MTPVPNCPRRPRTTTSASVRTSVAASPFSWSLAVNRTSTRLPLARSRPFAVALRALGASPRSSRTDPANEDEIGPTRTDSTASYSSRPISRTSPTPGTQAATRSTSRRKSATVGRGAATVKVSSIRTGGYPSQEACGSGFHHCSSPLSATMTPAAA
jgi:hypothetical protein